MPAADVEIKAEFTYAGVTINGVRWSEFNVDEPGKFTAKVTDYGMFYQWGRKTAWLSTGSNPVSSPSGTSWTAVPDGTDSDVWAPANDPCPTGWRLPTKADQDKLFVAANVTNAWTADYNGSGIGGRTFTDNTSGNSIFFPATGFRSYDAGALGYQGDGGLYWSATSNSAKNTWYLNFRDNFVGQSYSSRSAGFPVRCVR